MHLMKGESSFGMIKKEGKNRLMFKKATRWKNIIGEIRLAPFPNEQ